MELNLVVGGEAGQGLQTVDHILGRTLFRLGYHVYTTKDYMSRIRGGHNFMQIRFGTRPLAGPADNIDLLLALNKETLDLHLARLSKGGVVIYDKTTTVDEQQSDVHSVSLPAKEIAAEINPKGVNTVFVGAILRLLGLNTDEAGNVIDRYFEREELRKQNRELLQRGFAAVEKAFDLEVPSGKRKELFIDGNSAVGLGAAVAGVKFYTAYPMSPSTGIMNYLAGKQQELGLVVEQAEDEIAAINMALGASYGGIRAMTGTSGGGFALMTEAVGLAGITETPIVIADVQRPGPATGLPTRTEQGDLLFAINAAQGDFPLVVIAPRSHEDAFYQAFRAFNLAEKYQIPVILLSDQFLADSATDVSEFNLEQLQIERHLAPPKDYRPKEYRRYQLTHDGISPRSYPGQIPDNVVLIDSDEHDEEGHIVEDGLTRTQMVDKRARKLSMYVESDLQEPIYHGEGDVDYLLVCWGSTYGPLLEATGLLQDEGCRVGLLSFSDVWPLPQKELMKRSTGTAKLIVVEQNSTAQFARLISSETGIVPEYRLLKYDGRPFSGQELYRRLKEEVIDNG